MSLFDEVAPSVRVARSGTGIGVVTHGDRALLIDSGLDENLARKVVNALANEGVEIAALLNTHAHADHIGGNAWIHKRTGCTIAAPAYEHVFIERPQLEPYTLYGALPPQALRGKFLEAEPSPVAQAIPAEGEHDVAGFRVRAVALPGHTVAQMGYEVDGVLFVGDALLPEATLDKYGVVFAVDPRAARASAQRLLAAGSDHVVSYHGGLLADVPAAVRANVERMERAEACILARLARGVAGTDELLDALLDAFPPAKLTVELHALQAATLRGYLAALERAGRVEAALNKTRLVWRLR